MIFRGKKIDHLVFAFGLLIALAGFQRPAAAQSGDYVEGVTEITSATTSQTLYSYSLTYETYDLCLYYNPYVDAALYDNNTEVGANATGNAYQTQDGGCAAELDGQPPVTLGDTYKQVADHYIYTIYYETIDGESGYYNPDYYYGFESGNPDPSGTDYPPNDGGDLLLVEDSIYVGSTGVQITAAAPSIGSISPNSGSIGVPGSITVNGENLIDPWTLTTTPAITGSGVSLAVGPDPTDTQLTLNYSIAQGAATGPQNLTLATTFGTSNPVTFTVGDPPAVITNISPSTWTAGSPPTSVTITGTGFGTSPTLSVTGSGVALTLNSASPDGTTIQATATVAMDAPSETATVTVQPGYAGSGFTCNCQGQSPNGTNTATIQPVTPAPQIMFNSQNISGTTQAVLAGQKIALSVAAPSGYSIQSRSWYFPHQSAITGGFVDGNGDPGTQPSASAGGSEAADPPLNQNDSLTFYWVNPGDNGETVTYTYTLNNGQSASATATFNINGPTASTYFTATPGTGALNVWPAGVANHGTATNPWLEFGNAKSIAGMAFSVDKDALTSVPGSGSNAGFQWVQLIESRTKQYLTYPPTPNGTESLGLDNWYPYAILQDSPNSTTDSPGIELAAHDTQTGNPIPMGEGADKFSATMYLMWDPALPSGCTPAQTVQGTSGAPVTSASTCTESIPIPLAKVTWGYSGCAINTLANQTSTSTTWTLYCPTNQPATPTVQSATEFPQWTTTDGNVQ